MFLGHINYSICLSETFYGGVGGHHRNLLGFILSITLSDTCIVLNFLCQIATLSLQIKSKEWIPCSRVQVNMAEL